MNNSIDQVRALLTEWNILLSQIEEAMASLSVVIPHQKREEAPVLAIARRLASTLETMAKQRDALRAALEALVAKLSACEPEMKRCDIVAAIHGMGYSGPTYESELADARRVLEETK